MPAEFGLATATFVVIAGMVGTGILTTSGYTVAAVGSNQWMLFLWVAGGCHGSVRCSHARRALGRSPSYWRRVRLSLCNLRTIASVPVGLGVVFDRLCGPERGVGVWLCAVHPSTVSGDRGGQTGVPQRGLATAAIVIFATIHVTGRRRTARVQGVITVVMLVALTAFAGAGLCDRLAESCQPRGLDTA